jgi:hypothetical protein
MPQEESVKQTADDATDQSTSRGPADACRVQMKKIPQISDGAADDDIVVTEEEAAQR